MSFLDTICCAFGAVILLFVLSKFGEPQAHEKARVDLAGPRARAAEGARRDQGHDRGVEPRTDASVNRALRWTSSSSHSCAATSARCAASIDVVRNRSRKIANQLEGRLVAAQQELTEEMKTPARRAIPPRTEDGRRLASRSTANTSSSSSTLRAACSTTSGTLLLRKIEETLNVYPTGQGLPGDERRGRLHVPVVTGASGCRTRPRSASA